MKKLSKYIQIIIFSSSFALLGFLVIQLYWAKNTYNEKKENLESLFEICTKEVGEELQLLVIENTTFYTPSLSSKLNTIPNSKITNKQIEFESLYNEINSIKSVSIKEKRKEILNLINNHFLFNVNYPNDQIFKNEKIIKLIENTFEKYQLKNKYYYTITDDKGILIISNVQDTENKNLMNSNRYSVDFLKDDLFSDKKIFSLYIGDLERSILKSISNIFILSIFFILIIIGTFIYCIKTINNQKKITQIKTDFINNMTHEFKTPIATIGLACEALVDPNIELENSSKFKFLKTIKNENERLGKLVENVLESSVSEKGNPKLKLELFNIEDIIKKAIKSIQISYDKRGGKINTDFMADNKLIEADKLHITNVIHNLLDNSIKYTVQKPNVLIATRDVIGGIVIRIKDNGIGIDKRNHVQIFEKLFRVPTGDVHNVKGFGLGLSYVKSIIDLHNGSIKVESKLGSGSTFLISLKSSKINS